MAISNQQIISELWRRGNLRFLMKPKQQELRDFLNSRPDDLVVANAHRQFGKSTAMFAYCCEFALKNPKSIIKYGAPTIKQVKEILQVVERTVLETCPRDQRPDYRRADNEFVFANGSIIKMIGVDVADGDRLRGSPAHLVILDEAGFMRNLQNLIETIIQPQFLQTNGRLIIISTPSTAVSHDYTRLYIPNAKALSNYWELRIVDNPQFSERQIEKIWSKYSVLSEAGEVLLPGNKSERFRREFMCEVFTSKDLLIIPEWQAFKYTDENSLPAHHQIRAFDKPDYFQVVVAMDYGFKDHTGVLFGWVDFEKNALMVRDELFVNYQTPIEVAKLIDAKMRTLFGNNWQNSLREPPMFTADIQLRDINEIRKQSGIAFGFAQKHNKEAGITGLRQRITTGSIIVHPDCRNLALQLDTGTWKNEERKEWERTEHMGHLDLLDTLHYMNRKAPWNKNFTPVVQPTIDNNFIRPKQPAKSAGGLENLFGR